MRRGQGKEELDGVFDEAVVSRVGGDHFRLAMRALPYYLLGNPLESKFSNIIERNELLI